MARLHRRGIGRDDLCVRVVWLSAGGIRRIASELFVLRSELIFVYAAAGIYGADIPASGPAAEDFVWMLARIALRVAGDGGCGCGMVDDAETVSDGCAGGGCD